ncbi:MAG TPA: UvrB/UvrC motif-containing protein [Atribacterota bacterium]|nr:UvrB/UvrC motif-containing protein [Atribacterota bacterium]
MFCQICNKNKATITIVKIVGDSKTELKVCPECANSLLGNSISCLSFSQNDIKELLDSLLSTFLSDQEGKRTTSFPPEISCPNCGYTYNEFIQTGKLGCSQCYECFRGQLNPLLHRLHGHSQHIGIVPLAFQEHLNSLKKIEEIKKELQQAVIKEEYEKAAQLRDMIREEEKREKNGDSK